MTRVGTSMQLVMETHLYIGWNSDPLDEQGPLKQEDGFLTHFKIHTTTNDRPCSRPQMKVGTTISPSRVEEKSCQASSFSWSSEDKELSTSALAGTNESIEWSLDNNDI